MTYRTIVVSVDDQTDSSAVVGAARDLVDDDGLIVLTTPTDDTGGSVARDVGLAQAAPGVPGTDGRSTDTPDEHADSRPLLESAQRALGAGTFEVTTVAGAADAADDLDAIARDHGADLIVVRGDDPSRLGRLFGSDPATELVATASCPVLVVR